MYKRHISAIKAAVSILLLIYIINRVDLGQLVVNLREINLIGLAAVCLFSLLVLAIAAWRSRIALAGEPGRSIAVIDTYRYYLIAMFYNNFLPAVIGGDIIRIILLGKRTGDNYKSAAAVFLERIAGLSATLLIPLTAVLFLPSDDGANQWSSWLAVILVLYDLFLLLIFSPGIWHKLKRILPWQTSKPVKAVETFIAYLQDYRQRTEVLLPVEILSIIYQTGDILVAVFLGNLLGIDINPAYYFLFIPLVYIATLIPVSINGLGVREGMLVFLLAGIGIPSYQALLLSFLIYLDRVAKGIIGGLIYLGKREERVEAEL